jgi:hypothetical protein
MFEAVPMALSIFPPNVDRSMGKVDADGNPILTETWMLWHELVVYCHSSDAETDDSSITGNCLSADYIKEVIKGYILMDSNKNEYQIAVSDANVHAAVDAFPDSTPRDGTKIVKAGASTTFVCWLVIQR